MRILHLGNIANIASVLADFQKALGHESRVIAFPEDRYRDAADGVLPGSGPLGWNLAMRHLEVSWESLDAVHIHGGVQKSQLYYRVARRRSRNAAWIVHLHGSETRTGKGLYYRGLADRVLCSTPDLRSIVPEAVWLPNPVPIPAVPASRARGPCIVFGHFPTNRRIKGTDAILRAFHEAFGPTESASHDAESVGRWRWARAELIIGERLPHESVLDLMATCDAVVDHLSDLGPVSLVALEAMARRRAALSSYDQAAYPTDCPVIPLRPTDAISTLRDVVEDPAILERAAEAGRAYVEAHHRPEVVAARTIEIYEECRLRSSREG